MTVTGTITSMAGRCGMPSLTNRCNESSDCSAVSEETGL
jgi:hypothetical protein